MKFDKEVTITLTMDDVDLARLGAICTYTKLNKEKFFRFLEKTWGEEANTGDRHAYLRLLNSILLNCDSCDGV